ncbi:aspartic proteinase CDR1-like [Chenopodium quinoa]|nr:aspartic proteinase CDR1-like [Chenopodium quinoa]
MNKHHKFKCFHAFFHSALYCPSKFIMFFSIIFLIINLINSLDQCFTSSLYPPAEPPFNPPGNGVIMFSASLIHRSSPESPFYDPNYTREKHIQEGVRTSVARSRYFSQLNTLTKDYVAAPVSGWNLLMKYTMGTPAFNSYGIFDTGSSFTWVQCRPCVHCYKQGNYPIFNPQNSSTYRQIQCKDQEYCSMAPGHSCGSSTTEDPDFPFCVYHASYMDRSSRGVVSTETLTLSAENTSRTLSNMVFGCGHDNHDKSHSPGIVGVGNNTASLIRQLTVSHFSHYVFANGTHIRGVAHFGPGAFTSDVGMTTPLLPNDYGLYYLNLTGISVDGTEVNLPDGIFEKSIDKNGTEVGFIIDSGASYTMLRAEAFDILVSVIMDFMSEQTPESTEHFELCYRDISDAPEVVFHFNGLDYMLCDANLWIRHSGLYCLAMIRLKEREGKVSLLGFHQQRNVHIGYDLENNLLSLIYSGACPDDAADFLQG